MKTSENPEQYRLTRRWYLEMTRPPDISDVVFPEGIEIRPFTGTLAEYREMNKNVGQDVGWADRQLLSDPELAQIILVPEVEIYLLMLGNGLLGYTEVNFGNHSEPVIEYFGLVPKARGQGLGKCFLQWTLQLAWRDKPQKVKLTTTDLDHPHAMKIYQKAGFEVVHEEIFQQAVIR